MVVDHVEDDAEAALVGRVDEALQGRRAAVRFVDRPEETPSYPQPCTPGNGASGISSTWVTPRAARASSLSAAASSVPSGVKVPTCSS